MLNGAEVTDLNKQRIATSNREKAEVFRLRQEANSLHAWYAFLVRHSGQAAVRNDSVFYDCQANRLLIEEHIKSQPDPTITLEALEAAFQALNERLAQYKPEEYVRRADSSETRIVSQQVTRPPEQRRLPYTRQQVIDLDRHELRRLISLGHQSELNRILRGE